MLCRAPSNYEGYAIIFLTTLLGIGLSDRTAVFATYHLRVCGAFPTASSEPCRHYTPAHEDMNMPPVSTVVFFLDIVQSNILNDYVCLSRQKLIH